MKILVIEDEPKLNKGLVTGLQERGFAVDFAFDGIHGEQLARESGYDCIVLDSMLPGMSGPDICRSLRARNITTPIIFLTARDRVEDKIAGLDVGADDYLAKPFSFDELVARIRALLRRPVAAHGDVLTLDGLALDTRAHTLTVDGNAVVLTLREYGLLEYLLRNKGAVVGREDMLTHVWDRFFDSFSNVVDVHMKNLRKKLPPAYAERIHTVRSKGYRIV